MKHVVFPISISKQTNQHGAALVVSLIILVIMTMLGLAAIRGVTQQERMAGNSQSRNISFQATEKTLRDIEEVLGNTSPRITQTIGTCAVTSTLMTCGTPNASSTPRWHDSGFTDWTAWPSAVGSGVLAITPQYFVEYMGNTFSCNPNDAAAATNCFRYRITARSGDGTSGRAFVVLQSVYATN